MAATSALAGVPAGRVAGTLLRDLAAARLQLVLLRDAPPGGGALATAHSGPGLATNDLPSVAAALGTTLARLEARLDQLAAASPAVTAAGQRVAPLADARAELRWLRNSLAQAVAAGRSDARNAALVALDQGLARIDMLLAPLLPTD